MTLIMAYSRAMVWDLPTLLQLLRPKANDFGFLSKETYFVLSKKQDIHLWSSGCLSCVHRIKLLLSCSGKCSKQVQDCSKQCQHGWLPGRNPRLLTKRNHGGLLQNDQLPMIWSKIMIILMCFLSVIVGQLERLPLLIQNFSSSGNLLYSFLNITFSIMICTEASSYRTIFLSEYLIHTHHQFWKGEQMKALFFGKLHRNVGSFLQIYICS